MASSSSSSTQKSYTYDVFLTFCEEDDDGKNFADHLFVTLKRQGICTYKKGKNIKDELLMKSIKGSKLYIVVFSKQYPFVCLDELLMIMERQNAIKQIAFPVFYDVAPSRVRKQLKLIRESLAIDNNNKEEVAKWMEFLKRPTDLIGWDVRKTADGHEAKVINQIVESIALDLRFTNLKVDERLVGMESRIDDVLSTLENGVEDVSMIGIKGIGGGGKTVGDLSPI